MSYETPVLKFVELKEFVDPTPKEIFLSAAIWSRGSVESSEKVNSVAFQTTASIQIPCHFDYLEVANLRVGFRFEKGRSGN